MTIRNARDFNRFANGMKRAVQRSAQVAIVKGIGKNLPKLRGTAPVDTKEYRRGIDRTPVLVLAGVVQGKIVFLAPHSIFVHKFGYHEGHGRDPAKTGLKDILNKVTVDIQKEMIAEVSKNIVKGVVKGIGGARA